MNAMTFLSYYTYQLPLDKTKLENDHIIGDLLINVEGRPNSQDDSPIRNTDPSVKHTVTVYGPSDISGINPAAIARVFPAPNTPDFEYNYFPFIEFKDPDFLWRYSLDINPTSNNPASLQPWLLLIALTAEELKNVVISSSESQLTMQIPRAYLPEQNAINCLSAHTQINGQKNTDADCQITVNEDLHKEINKSPENNCCRLLCLRKLEKSTSYTLLLIPYPYYKQDNNIITEINFHINANDPTADIALPLYFQSTFMTADTGDFEDLACLLKPTDTLAAAGTRVVDDNANFQDEANLEVKEKRFFMREAALATPGFTFDPSTEYQAVSSIRFPLIRETKKLSALEKRKQYTKQLKDQKRTAQIVNQLNTQLGRLSYLEKDSPDPLVDMPYYGHTFQKTLLLGNSDHNNWFRPTSWHEELNLDFRNRIAAGLGTSLIQKHQEAYVKKCWYQVGDIRLANEALRKAHIATMLSVSLYKRYMESLSDEHFLMRTRPFHSYYRNYCSKSHLSLKKELADSGLPRGVLQLAFGKIAHQYLGLKELKLLNPWTLKLKPKPSKPSDPIASDMPQKIKDAAKKLRLSLTYIPSFQKNTKPTQEIIPIKPIDNIQDCVRKPFKIDQIILTEMKSRIQFQDKQKKITTLEPLIIAPKIDEPMYKSLKTLSLDYILPGLEKLPHNSVILCEENRRFIESYFVGLNHEIGRELTWRKFPMDPRGTVFNYFWDPATLETATDEELPPLDSFNHTRPLRDIEDIHQWKNKLGENFSTYQSESQHINETVHPKNSNRIVLLIKGDLIRRYPDTIIYAVRCNNDTYTNLHRSETSELTEIPPVFRGQLAPDTLAIGFPFTKDDIQYDERNRIHYYFVLQENYQLPRFGLDVSPLTSSLDNCNTTPTTLSDENCNVANDFNWGQVIEDGRGYINNISSISSDLNASEFAEKTYQTPIQLVIHVSHLLRREP